ncbi:ABC transporter substrate-binding protein [Beijerinckia indica]|nr:ABC transporter substrate-binding protein [Beijerinckia indica]
MIKQLLMGSAILVLAMGAAGAKDLKSVGVSVGSLGNLYFVALSQSAEAKAKEINPDVKVITVDSNYDLNKQFNQIDNFIASGVDLILLAAADPKAIAPAIKRAQNAGIVVMATDVAAVGADATVQTNNVQAGEIACQYIVDKLGAAGGQIIIQNGPQISSIIDRVSGCRKSLANNPKITILSDDQNGKCSRDEGMKIMQGHLTRHRKIDAVFTVCDPQATGSDLAAQQFGRNEFFIASVDGAPDIEKAFKGGNTRIQASASQDPYGMAQQAVQIGYEIMNGKKPDNPMILMPSTLLTKDNVADYKGWSSLR